MPFILLPLAPFLLTSFGDERSKTSRCPPLKNTARNFKKIFRFLFGFPKRKNPTVVANRQSRSLAAKNSLARPI